MIKLENKGFILENNRRKDISLKNKSSLLGNPPLFVNTKRNKLSEFDPIDLQTRDKQSDKHTNNTSDKAKTRHAKGHQQNGSTQPSIEN